ncbi:DNA2/NAM7-like helicase like protein, partial [Aduncisulcus paluster]
MGDNVCFIDIRGVKAKNHVNLSEAKAVAALVNKLKTYYNTSDIAVIAPYKNQVNAIQTVVNDPGVKVGTVHSFQGKDKEVVIMSMTISSASDSFAKRFIGGKPNMLNVAFTRSKQQLFIVGNLNVLENSERQNFLYKASGFAKDH